MVEISDSIDKFNDYTDFYVKNNSIDKDTKRIIIDFKQLEGWNSDVARDLLEEPDVNLEFIKKAFMTVLGKDVVISVKNLSIEVKLRDIGAKYIGKMLFIKGIVNRIIPIRPFIVSAAFECKRCHALIQVPQRESYIEPPEICNTECKGKRKGRRFKFREAQSKFVNVQELRIQERPEDLPAGKLPSYIELEITRDDLIDTARAGDLVEVVGILRTRSVSPSIKKRVFDMYIEVNYIETLNKDVSKVIISPEEEQEIHALAMDPNVYDLIVDSIAPSIYGHSKLKRGIASLLFGGVKKDKGDIVTRGEMNVLLIGDPASAKSQLLHATFGVSPRAVFASGRGASAAGLTAAVVKVNDVWALEAGAVVLADKGVCLPTGTKVLTNNGFFPIDTNLKETIGGKIEHIISRPYTGNLYTVNIRGWKTGLTAGHPVKVIRPKIYKGCYKGKKRVFLRPSKANATFLPVEQIKKHDFVFVPFPKPTVWDNRGLNTWGFTGENFFALAGWYLSEGSIDNNRIVITNTNKQFQKEIMALVPSCITATVNRNKDVRIYSKDLADYFKETFKTCGDKTIPPFILTAPIESVKKFLEAYLKGDGCVWSHRQNWKRIDYASKIKSIVEDIYFLILRTQQLPSIQHWTHKGKNGKYQWQTEMYRVYHSERPKAKRTKDGFWVSLREAPEITHYEGIVYNYQTESNIYAAPFIVHNCCIDEIDKMSKEDVTIMHEAMEQHTVSICKAGIVATLNARTAILMACNPNFGRYDETKTITENMNKLSVVLLSRFDLIFIVKDKLDPDEDKKLSSHVLGLSGSRHGFIKHELLRKYIAYARNLNPKLTDEANKYLQKYYLELRGLSSNAQETPVAITVRQLESLVRMTEAHARMRLKENADVDDAKAAIELMKESMKEVGINPETNQMDIDMIMTGIPKTNRDKMSLVLALLGEMYAITKEDVETEFKKKGFSSVEAEKILNLLISNGSIYEYKTGLYRKT